MPYRLLDSSPKPQQKMTEFRHQSSQRDEDILSRSAPQPSLAMQSDSEHSLPSPKLSDEVTLRDVQRTISLTSENHSDAFFSADEEVHASRSSSLKTTDGTLPLVIPKKRFASDLSITGANESGKLSSHRSDYEIHTPEHSLPTRPQSTAELVSQILLIFTQIFRKFIKLAFSGSFKTKITSNLIVFIVVKEVLTINPLKYA